MAKIKVSTVRQMADVQVINVNARLVSKATRASVLLHNVLNNFTTTVGREERDNFGAPVVDSHGNAVVNEHLMFTDVIQNCEQANFEAAEACAFASAFFDELVAAFESDEKEDKKKD